MIRNIVAKIVLVILKKTLYWWFALTQKDPDGHITETVLELVEQDEEEGQHSIDADERTLLGNVLDLKATPVNHIKIPRSEIVMLPNTATVDEILDTMIEKKCLN